MSEEIWDTVTLNKPKSYFNCMRHATPYMMKNKWGRIINTTSGAWLGGAGQNSNYCAANGGVVSLTSAVAKELVSYGITCNAFCPEALTRATVTILARFEKMEENGGPKNENRVKNFESHLLPEHIAPFITYLATDDAADITGTVFHLGGERIGIYSAPQIVKQINKEKGMWTVDELVKIVPKDLLKGYENPAKKPLPGPSR
jgi:NAD(P)-dependent dehydrogenase (short-subunit alcohol dehydrogenase family)